MKRIIKCIIFIIIFLIIIAILSKIFIPKNNTLEAGIGKRKQPASGILTDRYLAADGIENVISVLEQLEEHTISGLQFIELDALKMKMNIF